MVETKKKNWPPCYPLMYHDIHAEILDDSAVRMAEQSYKLWLLYIITLILNLAAVIATTASHKDLGGLFMGIIISLIYLFIFPIFDFLSRHMALYRAFKYESKNSFRWFFLTTALDILFGVFIGIGYFAGGGGGLVTMIDNFKHDPSFLVAGVFCAVCVFFVLTLTFFHFKLLRQVHKHFKMHDDWTLFPGQTKK